jgi:tetratricopeptide (TPR) repeat protein
MKNWITLLLLAFLCTGFCTSCALTHEAEIRGQYAAALKEPDTDKSNAAMEKVLADLRNTKDVPNTLIVDILFGWANHALSYKRYQDAYDIINRAQTAAKNINDPYWEARTLSRKTFMQHYLYEEGLMPPPQPDSLLSLQKQNNDANKEVNFQVAVNRNIGLAFMDNGDYSQAHDYFMKAIIGIQKNKTDDLDLASFMLENLVLEKKFKTANELFIKEVTNSKNENALYTLTERYVWYLRWAEPDYKAIKMKARKDLQAKDFDSMDKYAADLRKDSVPMANGRWPIDIFMHALENVEEAESNEKWQKRINYFEEWIAHSPKSPTPKIALANLLGSYAWKARGTGWSDSVSKDGWKLMADRLQRADDILHDVGVKTPDWYDANQTIALGQGWKRDEYFALISECMASYPTYYNALMKKAYWLEHKWYGKEGELKQFVEEEANKQPSKDDGDLLYARIAWDLGMYSARDNDLSWPRIKSGFEVMKKRYPNSHATPAMLTAFAMFFDDKAAADSAVQ